MPRYPILAVVLAFAIGAVVGWGLRTLIPQHQATLVSLSPDERYCVRLIERSASWAIDRNFALELTDSSGKTAVLFRSPDEGRPIGSERIVWSPDSSKFVLLGRHFYVVPEAKLENGEQLYLWFICERKELRCNADQSRANRFELHDVPWVQPR